MAQRALAEGPEPDVAQFEVGKAVGELAGPAARAGVDPASPEALEVVERLEAMSPKPTEDRVRVAERIEAFTDRRVGRYWTLVGIVNGRPPLRHLTTSSTPGGGTAAPFAPTRKDRSGARVCIRGFSTVAGADTTLTQAPIPLRHAQTFGAATPFRLPAGGAACGMGSNAADRVPSRRIQHADRSSSSAGGPVDSLTDEVCVPVVARPLLDQVDIEGGERDRLAAHRRSARVAGTRLPRRRRPTLLTSR